jgi:hypothetical protein
MITKTRKQGNSIMITVPKEYKIAEGVTVEPELKKDGIFYRFVQTENNDPFDFDSLILSDVIAEGYEGQAIINEFEKRKEDINNQLVYFLNKESDSKVMTREEMEREIGL